VLVLGTDPAPGPAPSAPPAATLTVEVEGLAASNDARGFMGPPSFEKARVEVVPGAIVIAVRVTD
jgi:uncharacterized protein (DUF2141 family)